MRLRELGEFGLIEKLPHWTGMGDPSRLLVGIGDDAAVWREGGLTQIATTDTLVEGVHFRAETLSFRDLGWKALAVNLSDIAAMGGEPSYALITLGLPSETPIAAIQELYAGMGELAAQHGVSLIGGDLVRAPQLFVTVAVMGKAGTGPDGEVAYLLRSTGQPGDALAVTGTLGASRAGLALLLGAATAPDAVAAPLKAAHQRPQPRLAEATKLLRVGVRCAMDISDGLVADLEKLCKASGVAAVVEADALPIAPALREIFPKEALEWALSGGEDYELLIAAPEHLLRAAQEQGVALTIVGRMQEGQPGQVRVVDSAGRELALAHKGWDHFQA